MFARLITFNLGPGARAAAEKLVDQFALIFRTRKGFKGATFFADETDGEYGALILWETKESVEAEGTAVIPRLQEALAGIAENPPFIRLFQVYEPRT
ncbi:MAG: hypothetical protein KGJ80_11065 [Chloroflexota bacterium]|nr:hypothetical protein [Chloroflexota bacterium]